jgi:hypothetical protein
MSMSKIAKPFKEGQETSIVETYMPLVFGTFTIGF